MKMSKSDIYSFNKNNLVSLDYISHLRNQKQVCSRSRVPNTKVRSFNQCLKCCQSSFLSEFDVFFFVVFRKFKRSQNCQVLKRLHPSVHRLTNMSNFVCNDLSEDSFWKWQNFVNLTDISNFLSWRLPFFLYFYLCST